MIRGAVVGLGVMGRHHLRVLGSFRQAGVAVTAVVDPDGGRRDSALQTLINCRGYSSFADALANEQLDFVCVATPIEFLAEVSSQALQRRVHVLVEKPMAPSLSSGHDLMVRAEGIDRVMMVGLVERFNPAVRALKDKLSAGTAGRILHMQARRLSPFPKRALTPGVALDLSIHDIDVMRYLTDAEVVRVSAETTTVGDHTPEDVVCAALRFTDGETGLLETNWISPVKVRQLSVTCEQGMFVVDYLSQDLTFYEHPTKPTVWDSLRGLRGGGEGDMIRYAIERWEPLRVEWEAFFSAALDGAPVTATAMDGCAALSVAESIRRSGAEHVTVSPETAWSPVLGRS